MNASLKLRDGGQLPLLKIKLPLKLLGLPLCPALTLGHDHDLALRFGTVFGAGPSCEISYRPNDSARPLCLGLKAGFTQWGSPAGAIVAMAAEFNLLGGSSSPTFRLWIKPQAGDFSLRKDFSSTPANSRSESGFRSEELAIYDEAGLVPGGSRQKGVWSPTFAGGGSDVSGTKASASFPGPSPPRSVAHDRTDYDWEHVEGINSFSRASSVVEGMSHHGRAEEETDDRSQKHEDRRRQLSTFLAGTQLRARTSLRIRRKAHLQIRWRVQIPSNLSDSFAGFPKISPFTVSILPLLLVDKIKVESAIEDHDSVHRQVSEDGSKLAQVETMCLSTRNALHLVQLESEALKKAIEDMRKEVGSRSGGLQVDKKPIIELPAEDEELLRTQLFQDYLDNKSLLN